LEPDPQHEMLVKVDDPARSANTTHRMEQERLGSLEVTPSGSLGTIQYSVSSP